MTFILVIAICFYGALQSIKLLTFDETDVMVSQRDSFYSADFTYSNGLAFAFGVTAYDSETESIEDPTIGVLKPYYKSWGLVANGQSVDFEPLPTRECTKAELHVDGETSDDSTFFKPHQSS